MNTDIQPDGSIRIHPVRRKLWLPLLGAIAFRERSAILHAYHVVVGVASILFFGGCAVLILGRILSWRT